MTRRASYAAVCAVVLAITLTACGSDSTPTGGSTTSANITFMTDPAATVWIDGVDKGQTPIVIAVDAGSHEVVLKAEGFEDMKETIAVEAGKDLTVDTGLMLAGTDVGDYKRLLATLGIEHQAYGETPKAHRGLGDSPVMLYWPQSTMRHASLGTYRIEVTPEYENDGYIEFRKGKNVLHREKFEAEDLLTERAIPASVMEAMKAGGKYSWGVYYESKRKKPVVAKFDIASRSKERKFSRKVSKIRSRKTYQRANPLMRAMANVDLLRDNRFYAEALRYSLSMVNTWPTTEMPFKSIAFCCERLALKDSQLYSHVGESLRGSGATRARQGLSIPGRTEGTGGQTSSLPPSVVAPRVRDTKPTVPGGMGVTPTPDAQKRKPGAIEPATDGNSAGSDATGIGSERGAGDAEIVKLRDLINQSDKELEAANEAVTQANLLREAAEAAQERAQDALQNAEAAAEALRVLEEQEAATPGSVPQADLEAARENARVSDAQAGDAAEAAKSADEQAAAARREADKVAKDAADRRKTLDDQLKLRLEALGVPSNREGADKLDEERAVLNQMRDEAESNQQALTHANDMMDQAVAALQTAEAELERLSAIETPTPAELAELEAAAQAVSSAHEESARARMEFERTEAAVQASAAQIGSQEELIKQLERDMEQLSTSK